MYVIPNITNEPNQVLSLVLPDGVNTAKVTLRYLSNLKAWYMDMEYKFLTINNRRVCNNLNLLRQWKHVIPFGLGCVVSDGSEPFFIDDFANGRANLMLLAEEEVGAYEEYLQSLRPA
jgi:hypothetical protein